MVPLKRIVYDRLNAKQREIYNFHKVAALLADYGFNCIRLDDDWQGADFLAYQNGGSKTLKVQLKSRVGIDRKYQGKGLYIAFPADDCWYLLPHDKLIAIARETTGWLQTSSWKERGAYSATQPSRRMLDRLSDHALRRSVQIDCDDEMLSALGMTADEFRKEARMLVAVKLHEMGRLSTGAAARMADMPKPLFLTKLADYGVDAFAGSEEELRQDLANAREYARNVPSAGRGVRVDRGTTS